MKLKEYTVIWIHMEKKTGMNNMKIKNYIINVIVENVFIYKEIYVDLINVIKEDIDPSYIPRFTFDEFCVKLINNFDGVDDDINEYLEKSLDKLPKRLLKSVMRIALDEFDNDEVMTKKIYKIFENN